MHCPALGPGLPTSLTRYCPLHEIRGDFVDYREAARLAGIAGWTVNVMPTGALPHFEDLPGFVAAHESLFAVSGPSDQATAGKAPVA